MSSWRERALTLALALTATAAALGLAEWILRVYEDRIASSSMIEPGLLKYHAVLGWSLAPYWQGEHHHHDFDVTYRINADGFRGEFPLFGAAKTRRRIAVLGDSFTFGIGVDDAETFVARLAGSGRDEHLNFAVPGYSTDQQLLQLPEQVLAFEPDAIWVVVYLGNDLIDNALAYPLQAELAKPYFELGEDGTLLLRGSPPPARIPAADLDRPTLEQIAFGDALTAPPSLRLVARFLPPPPLADAEAVLARNLAQQTTLFSALLDELVRKASPRPLMLVLLPGQSAVVAPDSPAAALQAYASDVAAGAAQRLGVATLDLTDTLRARCAAPSCFHQNEGHLNAIGHQVVADAIKALRN
ncbi:MAG: SGNH/GDSL hydrolase family protein [Gammaproteobacteria bacterium]|nr:SGNH/GDSL hydrolase family protein [Gammaproteobacteria bacterium]